MSKTKAWLNAMRLRTLPLSLAGIIMGSAIAYYQDFWNGWIFGLALTTTILFQILSNLANDLGDGIKGTDNAERVGPARMVQSGTISAKEMKSSVVLTAILSLLSAGGLIYVGVQEMPAFMLWLYVGLALLCVLAAITYTVGKKAYGYHGLGDLMVFIFFGGVSVLGVYSLFAKNFDATNVLLAITSGLLSTAVLNLNNMRDRVNDAKSGKNTLVVKMGANYAKLYHAFLIIGSLISLGAFIAQFDQPLLFITMLPGLLLLLHLRTVMQTSQPQAFDPELKKVALSTFAISIVLFGAIIYLKSTM